MRLSTKQKKTLLWSAVAVAAIGAAAVVWWVARSKRKHNGLVVIGNVAETETETPENMTTNHFNDQSLPRGYRNNNPLNIRKNAANAWKGKVIPGDDPAFEQFVSMAYGYRAGLKLLRNYIGGGNNTIRKIINTWAPPSDGNNTSSYVTHVAQRTGIGADTIISRDDRERLCKIAWAMAWSENGYPPATMDDIYAGWALL